MYKFFELRPLVPQLLRKRKGIFWLIFIFWSVYSPIFLSQWLVKVTDTPRVVGLRSTRPNFMHFSEKQPILTRKHPRWDPCLSKLHFTYFTLFLKTSKLSRYLNIHYCNKICKVHMGSDMSDIRSQTWILALATFRSWHILANGILKWRTMIVQHYRILYTSQPISPSLRKQVNYWDIWIFMLLVNIFLMYWPWLISITEFSIHPNQSPIQVIRWSTKLLAILKIHDWYQ